MDLTRVYAKAFDVKRKILLGPNAKLLLLKRDGKNQSYKLQHTANAGWDAYFSDYFGATTFRVADASSEFKAKADVSSHIVVIDSFNAGLNNSVHAMKKETQSPAGINPYWKIRAEATGDTYTPPEPEP